MPANDLYSLRLQLICGGVIQYFYLTFKGLTISSTGVNLTDRWRLASSSDFSALAGTMSNQCSLIRVRAVKINAGTPDITDVAADNTLKGTIAAVAHPPNVNGYLKWTTGSKDRRKIGHNYMPAIPITRVSAGVFTINAVSSYNFFVSRMTGQYGPSGANANWRIGVYSIKNGGHPPAATLAGWTQITGGAIAPIVTTNKKRGIDHAANFVHPWL